MKRVWCLGSHAGTANQEKRGTHSHKFGVTRINFKVNVDERVKSFNPCCSVLTDILHSYWSSSKKHWISFDLLFHSRPHLTQEYILKGKIDKYFILEFIVYCFRGEKILTHFIVSGVRRYSPKEATEEAFSSWELLFSLCHQGIGLHEEWDLYRMEKGMIQDENIDNGAWILHINIKAGTDISTNIRSASTFTTICINIYKQLLLGCFLQHLHSTLQSQV